MIRCDGETISPNKTYSGKRVLELLDISYQNGYNRGKRETEKEVADIAFKNGYEAGLSEGSRQVEHFNELKELLKKIVFE